MEAPGIGEDRCVDAKGGRIVDLVPGSLYDPVDERSGGARLGVDQVDPAELFAPQVMIDVDVAADPRALGDRLAAPSELADVQHEADLELALRELAVHLVGHRQKGAVVRDRIAQVDGDVLAAGGKIVGQGQ